MILLKVLLFSCSGDMIVGIETESGSCDPDHAPFKGDLSSLCWDFISPTCTKFDHSNFSRSGNLGGLG